VGLLKNLILNPSALLTAGSVKNLSSLQMQARKE